MPRTTRWMNDGAIALTQFSNTLSEVVATSLFEELTEPTIVRIRGRLVFKLNATGTNVYEASSYRAGIVVAHEALTSLDINADTIGDNPWMWYTSGILWSVVTDHEYWNGSAAVTYSVAAGDFTRKDIHEIDISAMRKVNRNERLVLVLRSTQEQGTPPNPEVYGHLRVLVKE